MSIATAPTVALPPSSRPPMSRLARIELRKLHDTRSGFWLIVATTLLTLAVPLIAALTSDPGGQDLPALLTLTLFPMGVFLPIVGILSMTSEWSQRTALQTFTAVPQRERVIVAKTLAMLVLGVAGFVTGLVFALLTSFVAPELGDASLSLADLGQGLLFAELSVLVGIAFGMLFGSPALAIVVYFVLPTAFSILGELVSALQDVREWIDTTLTWAPLSEFTTDGEEWWQALTGSLVWIVLPAAIGLWLLRRREVS